MFESVMMRCADEDVLGAYCQVRVTWSTGAKGGVSIEWWVGGVER